MTSHQLGHVHLVLFVSADKHCQSHVIVAPLFTDAAVQRTCFLFQGPGRLHHTHDLFV